MSWKDPNRMDPRLFTGSSPFANVDLMRQILYDGIDVDNFGELVGEPPAFVPPYSRPRDTAKYNSFERVGKKIAALLDALADLSGSHADDGRLPADMDAVRLFLVRRLQLDGWRVRIGDNDKYKVLPPVNRKWFEDRRALHTPATAGEDARIVSATEGLA